MIYRVKATLSDGYVIETESDSRSWMHGRLVALLYRLTAAEGCEDTDAAFEADLTVHSVTEWGERKRISIGSATLEYWGTA